MHPALVKAVDRLPFWIRRVVRTAYASYVWRRPPFEGVYERFSDVPHDPAAANSWDVDFEHSMRRHLNDTHALMQRSTLARVAAQTPYDGHLRILDFGGGAGIDFAALIATAPLLNVSYTVVDLAAVCEAGQRIWAGNSRISFVTELPPVGARFDLVYAATSLHYAEDYIGVIERLASYQARTILLTRNPVAENEFVRRQRNINPARPSWVMSEPKIRETLSSVGYTMVCRSISQDEINVDNYVDPWRADHAVDHLFIRSGT